MVVAPYNAQVRRLREALRAAGLAGVPVGTVDKFQGREAPIVFYSMATSSAEDVPRSLQFLFSRNRLNVAVSRAMCLAVVVASPLLLEIARADHRADAAHQRAVSVRGPGRSDCLNLWTLFGSETPAIVLACRGSETFRVRIVSSSIASTVVNLSTSTCGETEWCASSGWRPSRWRLTTTFQHES